MAKQEAKTPRRGATNRREDVGTLLQWVKDGTLELERALAGYNKLSGALQTAKGQAPDDREQGLPIFTMKASADGVHALDVVLDLREVSPDYLQHVLIPLCDTQRQKMIKAAGLLANVSTRLLKELSAALPPEEEHAAAEEDAEDDEFSPAA